MSEEDLKVVGELFDKAKEKSERDGYLTPVLFAWAPCGRLTISFIEGNLRNILPSTCHTLRLSGYDRFALIIEGWIVLGEENLQRHRKLGRKDARAAKGTNLYPDHLC